jgi:hypothetical protein
MDNCHSNDRGGMDDIVCDKGERNEKGKGKREYAVAGLAEKS